MFAVRCSLVFLALLGCTQAQDDKKKCGYDRHGVVTSYPIYFPDTAFPYVAGTFHLNLKSSGCVDVVGSWAQVCAYDDDNPDVHLRTLEDGDAYRNGPHGSATLTSGGWCSYGYHSAAQGAHGALAAKPLGAKPLGAKPTVVPIKNKTV